MEDARISDEFGTEFIHLSLIDSAYAKVIFQDVRDVYPPDEDLVCTYMVASSALPVNSGDTVRLFKVGWSSTEEFEASVSCGEATKYSSAAAAAADTVDEISPFASPSLSPNNIAEMSVTFKALAIPKDDNNFYQFCYITSEDEIRGASTPFLFKSTSADDLVTVNDIESDLLLIQTRTTILEDNLQKTMKEKATLQMDKQNLEKKIKEQSDIIESHKDLRSNIEDMQKIVEQKDIFIDTVTRERKEVFAALKVSTQENGELKANCQQMQEKLQEETKEVSRLMAEIASQGLTIGSLLMQRKSLQSSADLSEQRIEELNANNFREKNDAIQKLHNELEIKTKEKAALKVETESFKAILKQSQDDNARLQDTIDNLQYRLKMAAAEYKRKYIEWYKLQKQLNKLQTMPKKIAVSTGVQSDSIYDEDNFDVHSHQAEESKPDLVRSGHTDGSSICVGSVKLERKTNLIEAMEKQLQKFQSSNNSPCTANASDVGAQEYPYPRFYPYPYPGTTNSEENQQQVDYSQDELVYVADSVVMPQQDGDIYGAEALNDMYQQEMDSFVEVQQTLAIYCPVCGVEFPPDESSATIQEHVDHHFVMRCPICNVSFERETQQMAYNDHVIAHID